MADSAVTGPPRAPVRKLFTKSTDNIPLSEVLHLPFTSLRSVQNSSERITDQALFSPSSVSFLSLVIDFHSL